MSQKAYNAVFGYGNTNDISTATTWTDLAGVKSIKPLKPSAEDIDDTVLDSTGEFKEFVAGLADGGECEITLRYDASVTATLYGFFRTNKAWRIKYSGGGGWKFNGYLKEMGDEEVVNGTIVMQTVKFKVTGVPDDVTSFGS